jgi:hypothetical protein
VFASRALIGTIRELNLGAEPSKQTMICHCKEFFLAESKFDGSLDFSFCYKQTFGVRKVIRVRTALECNLTDIQYCYVSI